MAGAAAAARADEEIVPVAGRASAAEQDVPLHALVYQAVEINKLRNLDIQRNRPWEILHGLLALRNDYMIRNGHETVRAIDWISNDATFKGERWFEATPDGARAHPYNGIPYDFEGHVNQTLAILSMCDLPRDHVFKIGGGKTVTMQDMIHHAQMNINLREEVSWTLWFLTHYVDQDAQWTMTNGQRMSMEVLVRKQISDPPYDAPCGGCHGLFALAYACNSYRQKHGQLRGTWLEAEQKVKQFVAAAKSMQNPDGSFATNFFKARGYSNNFNERIKSSGHMLEWLLVALPKSSLDEEWIQRGVRCLALDMIRNATQPADCGPLYHSLHALILYQQRMGVHPTPTAPVEVATVPAATGPVTLSEPDDESQPNPQRYAATENPPTAAATQAKKDAATAAQPAVNPTVLPDARIAAAGQKKDPAREAKGTPAAEEPLAAQPPLKIARSDENAPQASTDSASSEKPGSATIAADTSEQRLAPAGGCMPIFKFLELGLPIPEDDAEPTPARQADAPQDGAPR